MKLVRQEVDGVILSTSQQAHVNLQLVMFLGMHLESASKQWGYKSDTSGESFYTITLPLAISTIYCPFVIGKNTAGPNNAEGNPRFITSTQNSITFNSGISGYRIGIFWFVISK